MSIPNRKPACPDKEPKLQSLLFGELEGAHREALEHHLEKCTGCRLALEDARHGLAALAILEDVPLPFSAQGVASKEPTPSHHDVAWIDFQRRLRSKGDQTDQKKVASLSWSRYRLVAAAALLLLGFGLGRWGEGPRVAVTPGASIESAATLDEMSVEDKAVDALARAELLSDVGLRYVNSLKQLFYGVLEISGSKVDVADLEAARESAYDLIRDGRLLRRLLDPRKDEPFLDAINRAELYLEELAAVEGDPAGRSVQIVQAALRESRLPDQLDALDVEGEVDLALEASGWIGEELAQRKEF
jgi:hypothetical protein